MNDCYLHGFGKCDGKLTGEHYISKNLLEELTQGNSISIGGLPWIPKGILKQIGISSLVSNALCAKHNNDLSHLDQAGGDLFRFLDAADKGIESLPHIVKINGKQIERWLLKVLCGLVDAAKINNKVIPKIWKELVSGKEWPARWGLYVPTPEGTHVLAREFFVQTFINPATNEVLCARFRVAGVHLCLVLGRPDNPSLFGTFHPRGLIFHGLKGIEKRIEFVWPILT